MLYFYLWAAPGGASGARGAPDLHTWAALGGTRYPQGAHFGPRGGLGGRLGHPGVAKELQKQPGVEKLVAFGCLF